MFMRGGVVLVERGFLGWWVGGGRLEVKGGGHVTSFNYEVGEG